MNSFPYPSMRGRFDLRFYFVVGPDDCGNRPILDVVAKALDGGASFIQLRAKTCDVAEIVSLRMTSPKRSQAITWRTRWPS